MRILRYAQNDGYAFFWITTKSLSRGGASRNPDVRAGLKPAPTRFAILRQDTGLVSRFFEEQ
jgi:hypothetical protein